MEDRIVKEGVLWKRGGSTAKCFKSYGWKEKQVELSKNGVLCYFSKGGERETATKIIVTPGSVRKLPRRKQILYGKHSKHAFMITGHYHVFYFGADSEHECTAWMEALEDASIVHDGQEMGHTLKMMHSLFRLADKDFSGTISKAEALSISHRMNAQCNPSEISVAFRKRAILSLSKELDFEQFCSLWRELTLNKFDITEFEKAGGEDIDSTITPKQLTAYLQSQGNSEASEEFIRMVLSKHLGLASADPTDPSLLGCDIFMFSDIVQSNDNGVLHQKIVKTVYQDMTHPLSNYWVNSSHNTYLTGDQLKSSSTIDMYRIAFEQGSRCVELDTWDGANGEPIVYHGYTMTSKISFHQIIQCIKDYGFKSSSYPLILSLENHCSLPQQIRMAEIMEAILGEMLVVPTLEDKQQLPSPAALVGKVILKGEKSKGSSLGIVSAEGANEGDPVELIESALKDSAPSVDYAVEAMAELKEAKDKAKNSLDHLEKQKTIAVRADLSKLIFLDIGSKSVLIKAWEKGQVNVPNAPATRMCNISEPLCFKLAQKFSQQWKLHNKKHLSRIYPSGLRVGSSNLNPLFPWSLGCQIVAMNLQGHDTTYQLNHGRFLQNAGCGYVLKPTQLRDERDTPEDALPATCIGAKGGKAGLLTVNVLTGYHLPKPYGAVRGERIDPYVKLRVYSPYGSREKFVTHVVRRNGYNPQWNETFQFNVRDVDLSMFHLVCRDKDFGSRDDMIGMFSFPVNLLQTGLRYVPLAGRCLIGCRPCSRQALRISSLEVQNMLTIFSFFSFYIHFCTLALLWLHAQERGAVLCRFLAQVILASYVISPGSPLPPTHEQPRPSFPWTWSVACKILWSIEWMVLLSVDQIRCCFLPWIQLPPFCSFRFRTVIRSVRRPSIKLHRTPTVVRRRVAAEDRLSVPFSRWTSATRPPSPPCVETRVPEPPCCCAGEEKTAVLAKPPGHQPEEPPRSRTRVRTGSLSGLKGGPPGSIGR